MLGYFCMLYSYNYCRRMLRRRSGGENIYGYVTEFEINVDYMLTYTQRTANVDISFPLREGPSSHLWLMRRRTLTNGEGGRKCLSLPGFVPKCGTSHHKCHTLMYSLLWFLLPVLSLIVLLALAAVTDKGFEIRTRWSHYFIFVRRARIKEFIALEYILLASWFLGMLV